MNVPLRLEHLEILSTKTRLLGPVSLTIAKHEIHALVGRSGSGKSLLARAALGLLPQGLQARGNINLSKAHGAVFQHPGSALNPRLSIKRQLLILNAKACLEQNFSLAELEPNLARSYPHQLSGGQQQRACIALALRLKPDLLIADEITSALDSTTAAKLVKNLKNLKDTLGLAILFITHDLALAAQIADRISVIDKGRIIESGPVALLNTLNKKGIHPVLRQHIEATRLPPKAPYVPQKTTALVFDIQNLSKRYSVKDRAALSPLNLSLRQGQCLGIIGESGAGKSTVAKLLAGLEKPDKQKSGNGYVRKYAAQMLFQSPKTSFNPLLTLEQSLREALPASLSRTQSETRIIACLEDVQLDPNLRHRRPGQLSGGQCQKAAIARALLPKSDFIILDEPSSALDSISKAELVALLRALLVNKQRSMVLISHDMALVRALSHEIIVLDKGQCVERGPCETVLCTPQHPKTKALLAAIPRAL